MSKMRQQDLRNRDQLYLRTFAGRSKGLQIQAEQNDSRPRHSKRAGPETSQRRKNRTPRQLHLKTRTPVLCLPEIGQRQSRFRVSRETGTSHRLGHVNRRTAPLTKPRLPKSEEADLALTRTQAELRSAGKSRSDGFRNPIKRVHSVANHRLAPIVDVPELQPPRYRA